MGQTEICDTMTNSEKAPSWSLCFSFPGVVCVLVLPRFHEDDFFEHHSGTADLIGSHFIFPI